MPCLKAIVLSPLQDCVFEGCRLPVYKSAENKTIPNGKETNSEDWSTFDIILFIESTHKGMYVSIAHVTILMLHLHTSNLHLH